MNRADGEQRRHCLEQGVPKVVRRRVQHQRESDDKAPGPRQELSHQGDRAHRGEDGILGLVGSHEARQPQERQANHPVNEHRLPFEAAGASRQHHGEEEAGPGKQNHYDPEGEEKLIHSESGPHLDPSVLLPSSSITACSLKLPMLSGPHQSGPEPANRNTRLTATVLSEVHAPCTGVREPRRCLRWPSGFPGNPR